MLQNVDWQIKCSPLCEAFNGPIMQLAAYAEPMDVDTGFITNPDGVSWKARNASPPSSWVITQ
ncbi:MAG: hypothetical protein IPI55_19565 [Flavobacteriales bacterium]|nr:hypothetical protein [Flavobacteriales bacterium]